MRRSIASVALFAAFAAAACTDTPPTGTQPPLNVPAPLMTVSLSDYIQEQIDAILPKGFEDAVDARWSTVKSKKQAGDDAGAKKHLGTLVTWIDKKTGEITPPAGETKEQAGARLVLNMARWVYEGEDSEVLTNVGADAAIEVVPEGASATVVTPLFMAGVDLQTEIGDGERIIIVAQDPVAWPGHCNGPLTTPRCQYPLFYKFQSFPDKPLKKSARFAVCIVTTGDRRPLEYPSDEAEGAVHKHLRLARPKPATADGKTEESVIEGEIEILPLSAVQKGFTKCDDAPVEYALSPSAVRGGWLGRGQRALLAVASFAGRLITPKNLYAYDSGPEHDGNFGSPFNAVCYAAADDVDKKVCRPDLSVATFSAPADAFGGDAASVTLSVENRSRRSGGEATAASDPTTADIYLFADAAMTEQVAGPLTASVNIVGMRPDDAPQTVTLSVPLPTNIALDKQYYIGTRVAPNRGLKEVGEPTDAGDPGYANNKKAASILIKKKRAIAIYKNYNAWFGENKDETVLQAWPFNFAKDVDYEVRPMAALQSGIPSATSVIIVTSASAGGDHLNQISEQRAGAANLEAWVRNGGWLVIHAGDNAEEDYIVPGLSGPVDDIFEGGGNCTGLTLAVSNHAFIRGPDATLGSGSTDDLTNDNIDNGGRFCYDNHGSLLGLLPDNAEVLIKEQVSERPVYATYTLGSGRVIVTTLTIEFDPHSEQTLISHFYWAIKGLNAPAAPPRPLASLSPSLNASGADEVKVNSDGSPRNP